MSLPFYDRASAYRFFDAWEETPAAARDATVRRRLDDYVRMARELPFYRGRLDGYDPKAPYPLRNVPVLTPDELKASLPPFSRALVRGDRDNYCVFQSGGTTGFPKTALFSSAEMEAIDLANARGYYATGLLPTDRVGNLFAVGSLYMTFIHINNMLQRYGCTSLAFSHVSEPAFFKTVAERFGVNVLAGVSSIILNMLREVAAQGETTLKIERIYYGGEHMYDADKKLLAERFGTQTVLSPGYGTVDTWYIGYQCTAAATGVFHAFDDQCYLEIVDEDTGEHCPPGATGMTYATPFPRELTPIVRYRVGDLARWSKAPCVCGRATPTFELFGRGDDKFRIGFDTIDYDQILAVLAPFGARLGPAQMERRRRDSKDELVLRIECEAPPPARSALAAEVALAVVGARPVLRKNIAEGTAWPVVVELVDARSLPLNPRTGKLKRVIDFNG